MGREGHPHRRAPKPAGAGRHGGVARGQRLRDGGRTDRVRARLLGRRHASGRCGSPGLNGSRRSASPSATKWRSPHPGDDATRGFTILPFGGPEVFLLAQLFFLREALGHAPRSRLLALAALAILAVATAPLTLSSRSRRRRLLVFGGDRRHGPQERPARDASRASRGHRRAGRPLGCDVVPRQAPGALRRCGASGGRRVSRTPVTAHSPRQARCRGSALDGRSRTGRARLPEWSTGRVSRLH